MSPVPAINISVFSINELKPIGSSGIYTNKKSGVVTSLIHLNEGDYILIPSTHKPEVGIFVIILYSNNPCSLNKMK